MDGRGVSRDYSQAHQWLTRAARLGYPDAQYRLGQMYEHGDGVKRDRDTAMDWYRKASNQGDTQAAERLKRLGG